MLIIRWFLLLLCHEHAENTQARAAPAAPFAGTTSFGPSVSMQPSSTASGTTVGNPFAQSGSSQQSAKTVFGHATGKGSRQATRTTSSPPTAQFGAFAAKDQGLSGSTMRKTKFGSSSKTPSFGETRTGMTEKPKRRPSREQPPQGIPPLAQPFANDHSTPSPGIFTAFGQPASQFKPISSNPLSKPPTRSTFRPIPFAEGTTSGASFQPPANSPGSAQKTVFGKAAATMTKQKASLGKDSAWGVNSGSKGWVGEEQRNGKKPNHMRKQPGLPNSTSAQRLKSFTAGTQNETPEMEFEDRIPRGGMERPKSARKSPKQLAQPGAEGPRRSPSSSPTNTGIKTAGHVNDGKSKAELSSALNLDGVCVDMCSATERNLHIQIDELSVFEKSFSHTEISDEKLIIKRFQRSSADHKLDIPEEIRPPGVLRSTLLYIETEIMDREKLGPDDRFQPPRTPEIIELYNFCWDRTRMIRKDFILQNYRGAGGRVHPIVLDVHERIARYHILSEHELSEVKSFVAQQNMEQLGQTLKSLNELYDEANKLGDPVHLSPFEAEFRAYFILCTLDNGRGSDVLKFVKGLPKNIRESPQVSFAMKVFVSRHTCDYFTFFKLLREATYLSSCLMFRYITNMRSGALQRMNRAYRKQPYPLEDLVELLCFDDIPQAEAILTHHGLTVFEDAEDEGLMVQFGSQFKTDVELRGDQDPLPVQKSKVFIEAKQGSYYRRDVCRGVTEYSSDNYPSLSLLIHEFEESERKSLYPHRKPYEDEYTTFADFSECPPHYGIGISGRIDEADEASYREAMEKEHYLNEIEHRKQELLQKQQEAMRRIEELQRQKEQRLLQDIKHSKEVVPKLEAPAPKEPPKTNAQQQTDSTQQKSIGAFEMVEKQKEAQRLQEAENAKKLALQKQQEEEEKRRRLEEMKRLEMVKAAQEEERRRNLAEEKRKAMEAELRRELQRKAMEEEARQRAEAERVEREKKLAEQRAKEKMLQRQEKQRRAILHFRFHLWRKYAAQAKQHLTHTRVCFDSLSELQQRGSIQDRRTWLMDRRSRVISGVARVRDVHPGETPNVSYISDNNPVDMEAVAAASWIGNSSVFPYVRGWKLVLADITDSSPTSFGLWCGARMGLFEKNPASEVSDGCSSIIRLVQGRCPYQGGGVVPFCVRYMSKLPDYSERALLSGTSLFCIPVELSLLEERSKLRTWASRMEQMLFDLPKSNCSTVVVVAFQEHSHLEILQFINDTLRRIQERHEGQIQSTSLRVINVRSSELLSESLESVLIEAVKQLPDPPLLQSISARDVAERVLVSVFERCGASVLSLQHIRSVTRGLCDAIMQNVSEPMEYPPPELQASVSFPPPSWNSEDSVLSFFRALNALATAELVPNSSSGQPLQVLSSVTFHQVRGWIDCLLGSWTSRISLPDLKRIVHSSCFQQSDSIRLDAPSSCWQSLFNLVFGAVLEAMDGLEVFVPRAYELPDIECYLARSELCTPSSTDLLAQIKRHSTKVPRAHLLSSLQTSFGVSLRKSPLKRAAWVDENNAQTLKRFKRELELDKLMSKHFQSYLEREVGRWGPDCE